MKWIIKITELLTIRNNRVNDIKETWELFVKSVKLNNPYTRINFKSFYSILKIAKWKTSQAYLRQEPFPSQSNWQKQFVT